MVQENSKSLLNIDNLRFSFRTYAGEVQAVRGVSLYVEKGKSLGIVGESGCGKSVTAKCVTGLNPKSPVGWLKSGKIIFDGQDLAELDEKAMRKIRAKDIRMIFQDPMTSLNPTMKIGRQIVEGVLKSGVKNKNQAKAIALKTLEDVGIHDSKTRFRQYPHEISGGMRQRVMIALAMSVQPKLLIADEPTTALDVTIQAQILDLLRKIQKEYGTSIIMITHDLGVVANIADNIAVMYAGQIVEYGSAVCIFENPAHPYTWGVLKSIPPEDTTDRKMLKPIPGSPPDLFDPPKACAFASRCAYASRICSQLPPPELFLKEKGHKVACWLYHPQAPKIKNPITDKIIDSATSISLRDEEVHSEL